MRPRLKKYFVLALVFLSWGYFSSRAQAAQSPGATSVIASGLSLPR